MFVSKNQVYVFLACIAIGGAGGILFTVSAFFKRFIKNNYLRIIPDLTAFSVFAAVYVFLSYRLAFPSFRLYMAVGAIVGLSAYMKSFHIILAIFAEKLYNNTVNKITAHRRKLKASEEKDVGKFERRKRRKIRERRKYRKSVGRAI